MPPELLDVRNLTVSYGGLQALSRLSLQVPSGAVVALLGPNGAGKTTTLRALSGLVRPDDGEILLEGQRIDGWTASRIARAGVAHVPEGRGIFPALSLRENLRLVGLTQSRGDTVGAAVELFPELSDRLDQRAGTLSGGQQQMVALARALVVSPRLLLLDEISTGLAPLVVRRLLRAVAAAASAGTGVLMVEQYVQAALEVADYAYILESGRLVDAGEAADISSSGLASAYLGAS